MMSGLISGIVAIISLLVWLYNREPKDVFEVEDTGNINETEREEAHQTHGQTREIVLQALKDLQCEPTLNEEHPEWIDFDFQGETFRIVTNEGKAFVTLYDCFWATVEATDLDDVSNMRRVINDINWTHAANTCYTMDDNGKVFDLHNTFSMLCLENSDFKEYLKAMMDDSFKVQRQFHIEMAKTKSKT